MKKILIVIFSLFSINSALAKCLWLVDVSYSSTNMVEQDSAKVSDSLEKIGIDTVAKPKYFYGIASFYSKSLEGTRTANDEIFRHNKLTAASNKFKLGTWLRVTNISNNKSIIVRVNDRMHPKMAARGRIVDLSYLGAKKLAFINKGLTKVQVEIVPKGTKE